MKVLKLRRALHRLSALRDRLLVHADRRVPARQVGHPGVAVRGPHLLRALHVHAVRGGLVHDRLPRGRHHHQRGGRQGRASTTCASAASSARSPARTGRCSTTPTRARRSSATSAAAIPPAPTPVRPRPSIRGGATRDWLGDFAARARRATCWPGRRPLMPTRHLIIGGGTAGMNAIRTIREEERERLRDHAGQRREAVLAHGAALLPRPLDRRVARVHGHRRPLGEVEGQDAPRPAGDRASTHGQRVHARRRHRASSTTTA